MNNISSPENRKNSKLETVCFESHLSNFHNYNNFNKISNLSGLVKKVELQASKNSNPRISLEENPSFKKLKNIPFSDNSDEFKPSPNVDSDIMEGIERAKLTQLTNTAQIKKKIFNSDKELYDIGNIPKQKTKKHFTLANTSKLNFNKTNTSNNNNNNSDNSQVTLPNIYLKNKKNSNIINMSHLKKGSKL